MSTVKDKLRTLKDAGVLDMYAWHFACRIERMFSGDMDGRLFMAAALAAHHTLCSKHICLDYTMVSRLSDVLAVDTEDDDPLDEQSCWGVLDLPSASCAVGRTDDEYKPLIVEDHRIYLQRYHDYEVRLALQLNERAGIEMPAGDEIDPGGLVLQSFTLDESQCSAVQSALRMPLSIITGGPGTGKTTILCVILTEMLRRNPKLRIHACAPTGKAQARMKEAVESEFINHIRAEVRESVLSSVESSSSDMLPVNYSTVHRLLGYNPRSGSCKYTEENQLETDLVVVDEVSMADLAMTIKLFSAIPESARIILLGDKDQLAAVEMGAVLGDICNAWKGRPEIVRLTKSHRFRDDTHIGELKELINNGDATGVIFLLTSLEETQESTLRYEDIGERLECTTGLKRVLQQNPDFMKYIQAEDIGEAFRCFDSFRILCAVRKGSMGVEHINALMMQIMKIRPYQHGYPVMITANDYANQLFNGDVGLCFRCDDADDVRVYFPAIDGHGYRSLSVAQLPAHEPVFAMTIHKSQGSGFDRVLVVLPHQDLPMLTRELLYTGLTRTRRHCTVWADRDILRSCVTRATQRMSGLADRLINSI